LGNLGDLYYKINKVEESIDHLSVAIEICDKTVPAAAGSFRGSLALVLVQRFEQDDGLGLSCRETSRIPRDRPLQVVLLFQERRKLLLNLHSSLAQQTFQQAKKIAQQLKVKEASELAKLIVVTEQILGK